MKLRILEILKEKGKTNIGYIFSLVSAIRILIR